jgi:hypothetical protein
MSKCAKFILNMSQINIKKSIKKLNFYLFLSCILYSVYLNGIKCLFSLSFFSLSPRREEEEKL